MNRSIEKPRLEVLTCLRFLAAALVVVFHCGQEAIRGWPWWIRGIAQNGLQTVVFFFVLSGFILAYNYLDADRDSKLKVSPRRFWVARLARIYPMYALSLVLSFVPFTYSTFVAGITPLATYFAGVVFVPTLLQSWFPPIAWAWNMPAWALSVEVFFYAAFPLLIKWLYAFKSSRTALLAATALVVLISGVCHAVFPLAETGANSPPNGFAHHFFACFPLIHLPAFFFGVAMGRYFVEQQRSPILRNNWSFLATGVALLLLFALHGKIAPVFLSSVILAPLYGVLIISAANATGWSARIFGPRWLVALGEASCGIYILHIPLAFWISRLWIKSGALAHQPPIVYFVCFVSLLVCFCIFMHKYFEDPLRRGVVEFLRRRWERV